MKNKLILILVAVVVVASLALVGCGQLPPSMAFVSPAKTTYYVGDTLDLTGGSVVVYGESTQTIALTTAMLDATTIPDFTTAGTFVVEGSYGEDFAFSFAITVKEVPTSYAFVSPAQTTYYVNDTLNLTGGKVTVYAPSGTENFDLTQAMLDATTVPDMATAGTYTISGEYNGFEFSFQIEVLAKETPTAFVSPAKKVYPVGSNKLNLSGATVTIDGTTVDVTADMLVASTIPTFTTAGNYTVEGSYQGYQFSFVVSVYAPIEFKHDADFVYTRAADVTKHVWMKENYADGTSSEWYNITDKDFSVFELTENKLHVEIDMCVDNYDCNYIAEFDFNDNIQFISVSEFKQGTVGTQYFVNGIVVAITSTVTRVEVILADKVTGEVVSASNLTAGGAFFSNTLTYDFNIGDEIVVPLVLSVANNVGIDGDTTVPSGDCQKLWGEYTGGKQLETAVLSSGNTAPINYSNAVEVTSQAQLKSLLGATNRQDNIYKLVHLKGEMKFIWYSNASQLRFWFADGNISSYTNQKIDSVSPVFCEYTQGYTTGKTFRDMLLGASYSHKDWATTPSFYVDIYALFIGGNNYYHKFVVLDEADAKPMEATITNQSFTAPTVVNYTIGSTLNLTGAKVTTNYDIKETEVVDVTVDMLDASTIPAFDTAGTFTITGNYKGYAFSFDIVVSDKIVTSIAIEANPTKTTYTHRDGLATLDLAGGKLRVTYSTGEYEVVDMDATMLPATDENWAVGTVNYTVSYFGCTTTLAITYQNTALTISQLLALTPTELGTSATYEVTGVVVGPASSYYGSEILIKEKNSNVIVGIMDKEGGVAGKYNAIALDTTTINVGDEIAVYVTFETWTNTADTKCVGGAAGRYYVKAKGFDFKASVDCKILSKSNNVTINLTDSDVTVIDSQADLTAFLTSPTRTYKYVKFVGLNYARSSASSANFNLFFGSTTETGAKINGAPGRISTVNANYYLTKDFASTTYMTNTKSTNYSSPASFKCDFYALCIGGNYAAHHFTILQDNWMLVG